MVAESVAILSVFLTGVAEWLHAGRVRKAALLAFGSNRTGLAWLRAVPLLRMAAVGALAWGLVTLIDIPALSHDAEAAAEADYEHIVLVLDVSPSMRLQDAGPDRNLSRRKRAAAVLSSFFKRVPIDQYRISVIAVYSGAKPVVLDTSDLEVVRNTLEDLPMEFAFRPGKTQLFAGLEEAAKIARPWNPRSTKVVLISDGDTVPARGMPRMPKSVRDLLVIGVGDSKRGSFIDGRMSRQDASTLRQIAARLGGIYHNANQKHLSSDTLAILTSRDETDDRQELTRREYALIAIISGASFLALLPILLHYVGTLWNPGAS